VAAVRGEAGRAAALAGQVLAAGESHAQGWDRLEARRVAGLAALPARDPQRAVTSLAAVWEHTEREGVEDPGAFPVAGDLAGALAEAGRPGEAGQVIGRLAGLAAAQQHPWGLTTTQRSAAVVTLAGGYDEAAAAQLAGAAAGYRALGLGFDAARALLVLGRAQRRAKNAPRPGSPWNGPGPGSRRWGARTGPRRPPRRTGSAAAARRPQAG
jgi:hypothetical protein